MEYKSHVQKHATCFSLSFNELFVLYRYYVIQFIPVVVASNKQHNKYVAIKSNTKPSEQEQVYAGCECAEVKIRRHAAKYSTYM